LYDAQPTAVACDLHPDYQSTRLAESMNLPVVRVQHHYAHVLSCMAEHGLDGPALGVSWDGTGFGTDGTIWGGEFLRVDDHGFTRLAHLATFRLPGGEQAIHDPRRIALALLHECYGDTAFHMDLPIVRSFTSVELGILRRLLKTGINAPVTSSMGRLFDGIAALIGACGRTSYEGQAAMALEFAARGKMTDECYPFTVTADTTEAGAIRWIIEWKPLLDAVLQNLVLGVSRGIIAATFHETITAMLIAAASLAGEKRVILSGGCFQNRLLLERAVERLTARGFQPYWQQRVPTNDGGIALGQVVGALREINSCV
jgi:hydrogenase maturation protein HypF